MFMDYGRDFASMMTTVCGISNHDIATKRTFHKKPIQRKEPTEPFGMLRVVRCLLVTQSYVDFKIFASDNVWSNEKPSHTAPQMFRAIENPFEADEKFIEEWFWSCNWGPRPRVEVLRNVSRIIFLPYENDVGNLLAHFVSRRSLFWWFIRPNT